MHKTAPPRPPKTRKPRFGLTLGIGTARMRAMQRETLEAILGRTSGLERSDGRWKSVEEHEVSAYIGRPGNAMALQGVLSIGLYDTHLELEVKDRGTFYTTYEALHAVLVGPRKERTSRGGVGF
jgi:hypothetical protein